MIPIILYIVFSISATPTGYSFTYSSGQSAYINGQHEIHDVPNSTDTDSYLYGSQINALI
ncbi:MAG: hypothetical protein AAF934_09510 [Bacteroidota bacterium]